MQSTPNIATNPDADIDAFLTTFTSCTDQSIEANPSPRRSFPEALLAEVNELRAQAYRAPEVVAAWDAWSSCMRQEGHEFIDRQDARGAAENNGLGMLQRLDELAQENRVPTGPELEEIENELDRLAAEEQAVADNDLACVAETGVEQITTQSVWVAETQWLEQNGDRVALLLAEN